MTRVFFIPGNTPVHTEGVIPGITCVGTLLLIIKKVFLFPVELGAEPLLSQETIHDLSHLSACFLSVCLPACLSSCYPKALVWYNPKTTRCITLEIYFFALKMGLTGGGGVPP